VQIGRSTDSQPIVVSGLPGIAGCILHTIGTRRLFQSALSGSDENILLYSYKPFLDSFPLTQQSPANDRG